MVCLALRRVVRLNMAALAIRAPLYVSMRRLWSAFQVMPEEFGQLGIIAMMAKPSAESAYRQQERRNTPLMMMSTSIAVSLLRRPVLMAARRRA